MNRKNLENLLDKLEISISQKGYIYWIELVELKEKYRCSRIGKLLERISDKNNVTVSSVDKALRYAFDKNKENIQKYFDINLRITISTLLFLILREMERMERNEYRL